MQSETRYFRKQESAVQNKLVDGNKRLHFLAMFGLAFKCPSITNAQLHHLNLSNPRLSPSTPLNV